MGKGSRLPARRGSGDAPHAIELRIGAGKVHTSPDDVGAARRVLSPMPSLLSRIFERTPDGIVRPATAQDAADAAGVCFEERARVVPRGAATGGLGGVAVVRGGVVVDLGGLGGLLDIDRRACAARAGAGAVWSDVIDALEQEGFAPLAYPSSASESTVGGWVSTGGYGVGTLKHGNFHSHMGALQVGLPSGILVEATGAEGRYSIPTFAGTEGQIGIVTAATFTVKRAPDKRATYVLRLKKFSDGMPLYLKLAALESPPDSVDLLSRGAAMELGRGWDSPLLLVSETGSAADVMRLAGALKDMVGGSGREIDASLDVREVFKMRLSALRGRGGEVPFYSGSLLVGADRLAGLVSNITGGGGRPDLALECRAVDRGTTLLTVGCGAQPGSVSPLQAFALIRSIVAAGAGMGGVPYGVGLWNSPYIDVILRGRIKELRRIKSEVDRLRIMNPGKFFSMTTRSGLRVPGWAMRAFLGLVGRS